MAYEPREIDYKNIDTRLGARRTSQEDLDAARVQAAGKPAPPHNPERQAWAANELVDRVSRTLMGPPTVGGNATFYTLSHGQFAQWHQTGAWEGHPAMPTEAEANAPDPKPENKEWTPIGEA